MTSLDLPGEMEDTARPVSVRPVLSMLGTIVACSIGVHLAVVGVVMLLSAVLG